MARRGPHAAARLQALWTLEALGQLDDDLVAAALRDGSSGVRENALKMAEGRFGPARKDLTDLVRRWPGHGEVLFLLGRCEEALGRPERALAAWEQIPASDANQARAAESKAALQASGLPAISNVGEKGGSAVAAAALNAIARRAHD